MRHSTKDALDHFSKKYPKYKFKRTSVNSWKASLKNNENDKTLKKIGRPNLLSDELLTKTKDVIIGSRLAGTVISRRMVIAMTGVIKANDPGLLKEFGGALELTENCARNVLKSMNWTKRKGTTGKVEPSKKFLEEEKFTFQRKISNALYWIMIFPKLLF